MLAFVEFTLVLEGILLKMPKLLRELYYTVSVCQFGQSGKKLT